jgi:integration host factor subunit alpha
MSFNKSSIIKNIKNKSLVSSTDSSRILESFILIIKEKTKLSKVKVSGFGTFSVKKTPKRVGRNPKTKDSYIIQELHKLNFKPSSKVKEKIN